jgi:eukaryotic translation initiation factor 2C
MSSTAFVRPMPLIEFVMEILNKDSRTIRNITPMELVKVRFFVFSPISKPQRALCIEMDLALLNLQLKKALRGVRIEVTHRGDARRKYRIASLTTSPPSLQL